MERRPPELSEWLSWPTDHVAQWVRSQPEPTVMGWPFNGTRRWYLAQRHRNSSADDYLTTVLRRQAELHGMVLDHGIGVILTPSFGSANLRRGSEYTKHALNGLLRFRSDEAYQRMFASGVRLRFYGDYEEILDVPEYRPILEACHELTASTADGDGPIILIGLFADSAHETIARLSVDFARRHGRLPTRRDLIEAYYGVALPDLTFYVGFEQPHLFDVPLVTTGREDLYVTLNPSPSVTERQFREILYDHLVTRRTPEADYAQLSEAARAKLVQELEGRVNTTLGLGRVDPLTGMWQPVLPGWDGFVPEGPSP